ncbi:DUF2244 domain-containing protein [Paracoccus alkanivorans]|uniref:DUF2244 domain-containing protein n=1 Tax=Paracoccus alkanivorans TaxID=2116655 RepID=A0A3M0M703_9RHOB|nr:DUF2244 domain-containing protein [Paracoccus alkanivorans]RMC33251.1 DUF2244 domain-containing protein [Paracoccus alkanivorans]
MPYEWHDTAPEDSGAVSYRLILWPYRSLPRRGFVWFIGITAALMALPLAAVLGTSVLWGLLPFAVAAIWAIWIALQRSYRSGETREELRLDRDRLEIWRHDPGRADRIWQTNPYWVRAMLREGPVENYLTLTDGQREIELGAFLTAQERRELCDELARRLAELR